MHVLIVAASDDALGRASRCEILGVILDHVTSLAPARAALQANPCIDAILIDAASDVASTQSVIAARHASATRW
jgi:hypothetical protein